MQPRKRKVISFHIPILATRGFWGQVVAAVLSIDKNVGPYFDYQVHISYGAELEKSLLNFESYLNWSVPYNVTWHRVPKNDFEKLGVGYYRFRTLPEEAELIVFCDADTCIMKSLAELVEHFSRNKGIAGAIAHFPPWKVESSEHNRRQWMELLKSFDIGKPITWYNHSAAKTLPSHMSQIQCPAYFNNGFLAGDLDTFKRLGSRNSEIRSKLNRGSTPSFFVGQFAITIGVIVDNIPVKELDLIYNAPNDTEILAAYDYLNNMQRVSVIHYLRIDEVRRDMIFRDLNSFNSFLNANYRNPINQLLKTNFDSLADKFSEILEIELNPIKLRERPIPLNHLK